MLSRRVWAFGRFKALNDSKLGYLVGGEQLLLACVHPQGSPNEATEVQGHLEVLAKDLFILHQVFCLGIRTAEGIVKNFPKKEINI